MAAVSTGASDVIPGQHHGGLLQRRIAGVERPPTDEDAGVVVEAQLGHALPGAVARIYNRALYVDERRRLAERWEQALVGASTPTVGVG